MPRSILFLTAALGLVSFVTAAPAPLPQGGGGGVGGSSGSGSGGSGAADSEGIPNVDAPGEAVPPVGASGSEYPTIPVLGALPAEPTVATDSPATLPSGSWQYVPNQQADADLGMYLDFTQTNNPQPVRGGNGATDPGPRTYNYDRINSDLVARPGTDTGNVPNAKWPMGLSSARSGTGGDQSGYARQQNVDELPVATAMAGVDMRLSPNAHREMHWHSANEWSYIFNGSVRISAVNQFGQSFVDDLVAGDLWFFPAGVPHSIQATEEGCEFLLVFNQGTFSEDATDLVTNLFDLNPKEVLAKNFQTDVSDFDTVPDDELYIFTGRPMETNLTEVIQNSTGPGGPLPTNESYSFHWSEVAPMTVPGGSVKISDPTVFPIATNFSAALFTIEPGAMREIHWHLQTDEWNFFLSGQARVTVFSSSSSRTFDFAAGDVGYIPDVSAHYVENTGSTPVQYIEILQNPKYTDVSVGQWLGLTPPQVVMDTLKIPQSLIDKFPKTKRFIVPGNADLSTTNFTVDDYPDAHVKRTGADASGKRRDILKDAYGFKRSQGLPDEQ